MPKGSTGLHGLHGCDRGEPVVKDLNGGPWATKSIWSHIFQALAAAGGPPADVLIDSSAVRLAR
jgi:hypothetical protein